MGNVFTHTADVHFDELDALGLLHHTRYLIHLERAQQKFFEHLLQVRDFNTERDEDIYVVVHSLEARFREALSNPGKIAIEYEIDRIRSGGVTMTFRISGVDTGVLYCTGLRTVCKLSSKTHQPTIWTPKFRDALENFKSGGNK